MKYMISMNDGEKKVEGRALDGALAGLAVRREGRRTIVDHVGSGLAVPLPTGCACAHELDAWLGYLADASVAHGVDWTVPDRAAMAAASRPAYESAKSSYYGAEEEEDDGEEDYDLVALKRVVWDGFADVECGACGDSRRVEPDGDYRCPCGEGRFTSPLVAAGMI